MENTINLSIDDQLINLKELETTEEEQYLLQLEQEESERAEVAHFYRSHVMYIDR